MAAYIPDSRLGRALRAGIPVALILLGAELLQGTWKVERSDAGLALSWSPPAHDAQAVRLLGDTATALFWGDCPDARRSRIDAVLGQIDRARSAR